jgi:hypothetical protein
MIEDLFEVKEGSLWATVVGFRIVVPRAVKEDVLSQSDISAYIIPKN